MMNYRTFSHPEGLCSFINRTGYKVIQIVFTPGAYSDPYVLFYGGKEDITDG